MGLDIRLPIGLMFSIFGLLLVIYGAASDTSIYRHSLGINVNIWWGAALLVFGVVMLILGRRGTSAMRSATEGSEGKIIERIEHREGLEQERPRRGH
ncbi:MAG TPA: hypothetical protein VNN73_06595 [Blastocatellia bacterium]|nr:hypothetical protein [Blastocatellia bacterium]